MKNACHLGLMVLLTLAAVMSVGCASLFQNAKETIGLAPTTPEGDSITKFSENPNVLNVANRNYKRMTRQRMEEEAEIHSQAGSMWVNDGQTGYLFAQNKSRREGDLLNVKIEGAAQKQIETKVAVIKKLLKQLEEEELKGQQAGQKLADGGAGDAKRAPAAAAPAAKPEEKDEPLSLEAVPTRIVERTPDGNYRVKGQQPFMIGKREYKVIVTGLVRPEDFNDEGIGSGKLLDPQYDVVSIRKKEKTSL